MTTTNMPQQSWREVALERSEGITDAWEVTKTYAGRLAEWILFLCMIMNIIEVLVSIPGWLSGTILAVQAVMLDVGGFSLASMADQAADQGNTQAAKKARATGYLLITIMMVTLLCVSIGILWPPLKGQMDGLEKGLILIRVLMTVLYGHVVHSLRRRVQAVLTPIQVATLEQQLAAQIGQVTQLASSFDAQKHETLTQVQSDLAEMHHGAMQREQILLANLKGLQDALPAMVQAQSHVMIAEFDAQFRLIQEQIESLKIIENEGQNEAQEEEEEETDSERNFLPPLPPRFSPCPKPSPEAAAPKTTGKLSEENHEETPPPKTRKKRPSSGRRRTAQEVAQRAMKRNPNITAEELAKKARITPQYAGKILRRQSTS